MAFGMGPRNCVGMRFALEELKMAVCALVQQFRFFPVDETPVCKSCDLQLNYACLNSFHFWTQQEKLKFDEGFNTVAQPMHAIVGIEFRQM